MGRAKFACEYCHKSFEDSQEARRRHFQGRNHKANVKLWYDSFADQAQRTAAAAASTASTVGASDWMTHNSSTTTTTQQQQQQSTSAPLFDLCSLPPSMIPPPPDAFLYKRADWG